MSYVTSDVFKYDVAAYPHRHAPELAGSITAALGRVHIATPQSYQETLPPF
jgi:hypothetical protein